MKQNGFDGIDIDWEFPSAVDSANFTAFLQELRSQLDLQGGADECHYLLTIAAPAAQNDINNLHLSLIHPLLDWINLMTYDFAVAHSHRADLVAPLFAYEGVLNVDAVVKIYLKAGVPADKIVMGVRFVGTGWQGVGPKYNGLDQPTAGPATGTWDVKGSAATGSFGYQDIQDNYLPTYARSWDGVALVPWLYNYDTQIMISYEDQQSLTAKAIYARSIGGVMIWDLAADDDQDSLVKAVQCILWGKR